MIGKQRCLEVEERMEGSSPRGWSHGRAHYRSQETLDAKLADRCNIINSY
jgi:hypothetical protein